MRARIKAAIVCAIAWCPCWTWQPLSVMVSAIWPGFRDA